MFHALRSFLRSSHSKYGRNSRTLRVRTWCTVFRDTEAHGSFLRVSEFLAGKGEEHNVHI